MKKTIGGDRLGSGKKMQVELQAYERSTHDLGKIWRSTMAAGTLVPFLKIIALPGDTMDIILNADGKTHPTEGPLFGSFKMQLDLFSVPIRLYNGLIHNNALNIGRQISKVKLPQIEMTSTLVDDSTDIDNSQTNPSSLLAYMGIRGVGQSVVAKTRLFNAIPLLAYYDIYKNYYANKQEEIGAVLHTPAIALVDTVDEVDAITIDNAIAQAPGDTPVNVTAGTPIFVKFTGPQPLAEQILINTDHNGQRSIKELCGDFILSSPGVVTQVYNQTRWGNDTWHSWQYIDVSSTNNGKPAIVTFDLKNIDDMRNAILAATSETTAYKINDLNKEPYKWLYEQPNGIPNALSSQEGLALKTYQSDLFNNWMATDWIDEINSISAVNTAGGSFTIDQFILNKKIWDMLNRVAVSGGTYNDWIAAVYDHQEYWIATTPMYIGGLSKELVFQEVVSNSQSQGNAGTQPLGTLAGRGVMSQKHKGGKVVVKVNEPSYIIGLVSLTPRIDNSQGNHWDVNLETLDDLHKPALDQIGFQESINEQRAWWSTNHDGTTWVQTSAGKQPAWINYMTAYNEVYGNFAIENNEMFMTLNRRYERAGSDIKDLTTYIDPSKYNFIFAQTSLDAQNFWVQIAVDITARRKMSAKLMPNL